jgi:hypothetical protein
MTKENTSCKTNYEYRIYVLMTAAMMRIRVVVNDYVMGWAVRERFSFHQNAHTGCEAQPGS